MQLLKEKLTRARQDEEDASRSKTLEGEQGAISEQLAEMRAELKKNAMSARAAARRTSEDAADQATKPANKFYADRKDKEQIDARQIQKEKDDAQTKAKDDAKDATVQKELDEMKSERDAAEKKEHDAEMTAAAAQVELKKAEGNTQQIQTENDMQNIQSDAAAAAAAGIQASDEVHRLQVAQNNAKSEADKQALDAKQAVEDLMAEREESNIEDAKRKLADYEAQLTNAKRMLDESQGKLGADRSKVQMLAKEQADSSAAGPEVAKLKDETDEKRRQLSKEKELAEGVVDATNQMVTRRVAGVDRPLCTFCSFSFFSLEFSSPCCVCLSFAPQMRTNVSKAERQIW